MNKSSDMSQLDWLWTNYGNTSKTDVISNKPSNDRVVTESAVVEFILSEISKVNSDIKFDKFETDDKITLYLKDNYGVILSSVSFEKGSKITKFEKFISTQEDVDKGYSAKTGCLCLLLQDSLGREHYIDIVELNYKGSESDSVLTMVKDNQIASVLKINNPVADRSVDIKSTPDGIKADIVIDSETNSSIFIEKSDKGISCHYKWLDEQTELKFKALTYNEYTLLRTKDIGTLYFITDLPCIYFRKIRYASSSDLTGFITEDEAKGLFEDSTLKLVEDIEKVNTSVLSLKTTVLSNTDDIKVLKINNEGIVNTLKILNSDEDTSGSILNIVQNKINSTLEWGEL